MMLTPEAARTKARTRYQRSYAEWAIAAAQSARAEGGTTLDIPLHPPSEAEALANTTAAIAWVQSWRDMDPATPTARVVWTRRRWSSLGAQTVPDRLQLTTASDVARFIGQGVHWRAVSSRVAAVLAALPPEPAVPDAIRSTARLLAALPDDDLPRLLGVLTWLLDNPKSGLLIRQLPVRGVDTKWLGEHRGMVTTLYRAATGRESLGLRAAPSLVRVRFLDPTLAPGDIGDLAAPMADLSALPITPATVLIVENLESLLSLPQLSGTVAIHGSGYAVDRIAEIRWVHGPTLLYWGDLDSHGFSILNQLRAHLPQACSVLMDREVLESYPDLWVPEPTPHRGVFARLTSAESDALAALRTAGDIRLEQERIPWSRCLDALRTAHGNHAQPDCVATT